MKKFFAFICAAVLTVSTAMTAFAQPSVSVSGVVTGIESATDKDGNAVEVKIENFAGSVLDKYTEEQLALIQSVKDVETLKALLGDKYVEGMSVVDLKEVTASEGVAFPITVTFKVTGVTAGSKVAILHFSVESNKWEVLEATAGEGTIKVTFDSLSPVAFVVDSAAATSPKTGETNVMAMVSMVAVLAAAGMVVVSFKRKRA